MNLKIVYYVATSGHRWGKGLTLAEAMKAAGLSNLKTTYRKGGVEAVVYLAIFKRETTDAELKNLMQCIVADDMWGTPGFYHGEKNNPTYLVDQEMIERLLIGWATDQESFVHSKTAVVH